MGRGMDDECMYEKRRIVIETHNYKSNKCALLECSKWIVPMDRIFKNGQKYSRDVRRIRRIYF